MSEFTNEKLNEPSLHTGEFTIPFNQKSLSATLIDILTVVLARVPTAIFNNFVIIDFDNDIQLIQGIA